MMTDTAKTYTVECEVTVYCSSDEIEAYYDEQAIDKFKEKLKRRMDTDNVDDYDIQKIKVTHSYDPAEEDY